MDQLDRDNHIRKIVATSEVVATYYDQWCAKGRPEDELKTEHSIQMLRHAIEDYQAFKTEAAQAQPDGGECKRCCGVGKLVDPDGTWDYCDCIEMSCPRCGVDWPRDVITSEAFLCGGCGIEYNAKRLWQLKSEKAEEAGGE